MKLAGDAPVVRHLPEGDVVHGLSKVCCVAVLMSVAPIVLAARALVAQLPVPGAPCSAHGTGVIRLQLLDPRGRVPTARANAVIVALRCGAMVDSTGVVELRGLPDGRHMVQVRALGFPPESVAVAVATGEAARATVQLHKVGAIRTAAPPGPAPPH